MNRPLSIVALLLSLAGCSQALGFDDLKFRNAGARDAGPGAAASGDCQPASCEQSGAQCGELDDGCGGSIDCGTCDDGQSCGAAGPNQCGAGECTPLGCAELGANCAKVFDGCATMVDCGSCTEPETCGGAGVANQCGCPDGNCPATCTPATCESAGAQCGSLDDGCGASVDCGSCPNSGDICGGAGNPHQCVAATEHHETLTYPGATGQEPGGSIPVCCSPGTDEKKFIMQVFALLNEHRQNHGKAPLVYDDKLEAAEEGHCHHMAAHSFFAHDAPESAVSDPWTRAEACGTSASGENIAAGQQSPEEVMDSWKSSPGHNANMLGDYTRVGIGYHAGGDWGTYWGQLFD